MWQLAHLASGALVGQQINDPIIAFGLGVGTHLLIDKIPHYWPKKLSQKRLFTVLDYVVTVPCAIWLIATYHHNPVGLLWGVLGSLAVDIILVGIPIVYKSPIGKWHSSRQPHHINPLYLLTDAAVIAFCVTFLAK